MTNTPEPVPWAPGLSLLSEVGAASWIADALNPAARSSTVAAMVPAVFPAYVRVLPPAYDDTPDERRHRWSEIAAARDVELAPDIRFDDLVAGDDRWGRPSDGGLDEIETGTLARVLSAFTRTPDRAYFCLWDGFGTDEVDAWRDRPARVRTPDRAYHLLTGPVSAAAVLPTPIPWRCAALWWPADRAWLVATDIDGYLTYVGADASAARALLDDPALDAVPVLPSTRLDPSYG